MSENKLTEAEAELYDRQIRLWGLDAQKRYLSVIVEFYLDLGDIYWSNLWSNNFVGVKNDRTLSLSSDVRFTLTLILTCFLFESIPF